MSRTLPDCPDAPSIQIGEQPPNTITKTYTITVITPIFGGGAETGVNDSVTLVRPSSIRGHLRFWWRATRGARFQTIAELRQREGEIWGTTDNPSPISIEVKITNLGEEEACATLPPGKKVPRFNVGYPAYVLFPFQGNAQDRIPPSKARKNSRFSLTLYYPQRIERDIQAATWAWVNFGGVGARTRRGCGALYCQEFAPPSASKIEDWLENARNAYELLTDRQVHAWPILTTAPLVMRTPLSPVEAWNEAVGLIREFRQGVGVGRNSGRSQNQPGRSRWPEPDSLRAITGKGDLRHSTSTTLADLKNAPAFPRAELGLPIVFHFKDSADSPNNSELYPGGKTRMASPIILRPLAVRERSQAVAMVLRLTTPPLGELELKKITDPPALNASNICRPNLAQYANSPLGSPPSGGSKRSSSGSALDAFIAFAKEKGFQECMP